MHSGIVILVGLKGIPPCRDAELEAWAGER